MDQIESTSNAKLLLQRGAHDIRANIGRLVPLAGLGAVLLVIAIATKGTSVSGANLRILLNQFVVLAIVSTGASFIFSMGGFDISLGAVTSLACVAGAAAGNASGQAWMVLVVCLATAVGMSLISAAFIAVFKLPSFLVTLAVYLILISAVMVILGDTDFWTVEPDLTSFDTTAVKAGALVAVVLLAGVVFNYMKLGRTNRIIGGSQTVARYTGMSITRNTLLSFLISGIGLGLGSFLLMARTGSVSFMTGQSYGFDIIIAIVLGGMPISGGARSRITAALVGACTLTVLNNGLVILGASVGTLQVTRGALFLIVVSVMTARHRDRLLAR
jgi:ribose transport system permease protein